MFRFLVLVRNLTLSKYVSVEDLHSSGSATNENDENLATTNSNDPTVFTKLT